MTMKNQEVIGKRATSNTPKTCCSCRTKISYKEKPNSYYLAPYYIDTTALTFCSACYTRLIHAERGELLH